MNQETLSLNLVQFIDVVLLIATAYYLFCIEIFLVYFFSNDPVVIHDANIIEALRLPQIDWTQFVNLVFFTLASFCFIKHGNFAFKAINVYQKDIKRQQK